MTHIAYIANIRLPTEKAHGYQICQMCRALAQQTAVALYHPRRQQPAALAGQQGADAFAYYGLPPSFAIHTLPNLDVVQLENALPRPLFRWLFDQHARLWSHRAIRQAQRHGATLFYTRDIPIADVLTRHGLPTMFEAHSVPGGRARQTLTRVVQRPSLQLTIVLTQFIQQALVELGAPPARILIEPDAVDLASYANLPEKTAVRQQLGLPVDRPIVGYLGRFQTMGSEKGIPDLIRAFGKLPARQPAPLLLCVGGPLDAVPGYQQLAAEVGVSPDNLHFVDRVPNAAVPRWLAALDIATMPFPFTNHYAYYMSPMKLFEYLAAGKTILGTALPSIQEVLTHNHNAWLVAPDDPAALAAGISHLLTQPNLMVRLAQQAQRDAAQYTWQARAQRILAALP